MSEDRGIIVLGMPRSGTTLLRRVLSAHPRISCPPETNLLGATSRFLEEHEFAGGVAVGAVPGLHFAGFDEPRVLDRLRALVEGFLGDIAQRAGKPRWAEKTAVDIFHIDAIERLFGERCQFVCLLRHPLDVVCSIKELSDKMEMYLPELHRYVARYLSPLEAFAHAWREGNARLLEFLAAHQHNALMLRYEDLVRDPPAEVARLFQFLGEAVDIDVLLRDALGTPDAVGLGDWKTYDAKRISKESIGRHATLDRAMQNRLAEIVNPLMPACGYPAIEPTRVPTGANARRHFELSLMVSAMRDRTPDGGDSSG